LLNFCETLPIVLDDSADTVYLSNVVIADILLSNTFARDQLRERLLHHLDRFSPLGIIGSEIALEAVVIVSDADLLTARLPPLIQRMDIAVQTCAHDFDIVRPLLISIEQLLKLPHSAIIQTALSSALKVFEGCDLEWIKSELVRLVHHALHRNSIDIRENLNVCFELVSVLSSEIALGVIRTRAIVMAIDIMTAMIVAVGSDPEERMAFVRLWGAMLHAILESGQDQQTLRHIAAFTKLLFQGFPNEIAEVFAQHGTTYGVLYGKLMDQVGYSTSV
jgi:hypothetical protein